MLDFIRQYATGFSAIIAALTFVFTAFKYRADRRAQMHADAMGAYRKYVELAFANPKLAEPNVYGIPSNPTELRSQYEWFVAIMLHACEEVLIYLKHKPDETWRGIIISQIRMHLEYVTTDPWFSKHGKLMYSEEIQNLIDEAAKDGGK